MPGLYGLITLLIIDFFIKQALTNSVDTNQTAFSAILMGQYEPCYENMPIMTGYGSSVCSLSSSYASKLEINPCVRHILLSSFG